MNQQTMGDRPVATQLDAIEQGLDKLLQSHAALEQEVRTGMNMYRYAHMCRDGHQQIGHNDSEHEMCPLCRALALCKIEQRAKKPAKRAKRG